MAEKTYIAILRGINVGSTQVKMTVLKRIFTDAGYSSVQTYIQSGNVLFKSGQSDVSELATDLETLLKKELNAAIPVIVLGTDYLRKVFGQNPFLDNRKEDVAKLHVTFLAADADREGIAKIETGKYFPDEFFFGDKAIYLFCPNGYGRTKLHNNFFEAKLKTVATTRNWKTVTELLRLADDH